MIIFIPFMILIMLWLVTLLLAFPSVASALLFVGKMFIVIAVCYGIGYGVSCCITKMRDKMHNRRFKRFFWYRKMGLIESAIFTEPNLTREYWVRF